ncbi:MAG: hypothetical protein KKF48_01300 [Nanoarchaeota archaeon]|nr:hypothetical protein [Nanoarchaeota archaeon]MBU1027659.1 hypothetical protein [Nanoarchaeota archaeon]
MKKSYLILISIVVLIILVLFIRFFIGGSEDSWIKDKRGVWIKHGVPSDIPYYVLIQQKIVDEAIKLYEDKKSRGTEFNSQCLGIVDNYAIDIVHIPRIAEDDLVENQCEDYRSGQVSNFIELDKDGDVVKIKD